MKESLKFLITLIIFSFLLSSTDAIYGQSNENHPSDEEIYQGLNLIYNLRFEEAEQTFKTLQAKYPYDVKSYFYESLIYFYRAIMTGDEQLYEKFLELSENVINKCEDILDDDDNNIEILFYKGQAHSYRSLLMLNLNKSLFRAAINGNSGYRILSEVIERNPEFYDAYMGLGLYKIALGFVPNSFRWLLSIIGFDGNIKDGLSYLRTSMEKGKFTKVDSKVYLAIFSIREREERDKESVKLIKSLYVQYPESPIFKLMYAGFLQQIGEVEESIRITKDALRFNDHSLKEEVTKSAFGILGNAYFRKNDFRKTIEVLEAYLKFVKDDDKYNVVYFTIGSCYELLGDRETALKNYRMVRDKFINERDGEGEKLFYRYAMENIKEPIDEYDSILVVGMNLRESNYWEESLSVLSSLRRSKLTEKYNTDDDKIRLYYELGNVYLYMDYFTEAKKCFEICVALHPQREKWLVPHSYFELGKLYIKLYNKEKAEEMFDKISEYSDYDMETLLEMRLASFKERM
ncbi:tetratricopeptide repeat protein [Bacteroidota bacterium]